MILYHGSNMDIDAIDLSLGHKYKDFGQGFYLTPEQAALDLQDKFLDQQYYFGTQKALQYIRKINTLLL